MAEYTSVQSLLAGAVPVGQHVSVRGWLRMLESDSRSPPTNRFSLNICEKLKSVSAVERGSRQNLTPRSDNPRIFLAPVAQLAPDGRRLKDVFGGRTLTFDEFNARVAQ